MFLSKVGFVPREGGDSHMKLTGMLVVWLRGVNCRDWSRLGYPGCQRLFLRGFLARFPVAAYALYCDPREKPLDQRAIALMPPSRWLACLNRFSPEFGLGV